jgi:outer membrane protein TolC
MLRIFASKRRILAAMAAMALAMSGCTSLHDYVSNGFKVGPNYSPPPGPVAGRWIESDKHPLLNQSDDLSRWWCVFADPTLNQLIAHAYRQNLSVKAAGEQIKQAQAQLGMARGELFPQNQNITGSYTRSQFSTAAAGGAGFPAVASTWNLNANLAWQLDFWGYYRRAIEAAGANVDASVANYDQVVIVRLAAVAYNYVEIRTDQQRLIWLEGNWEVDNFVADMARNLFKEGRYTDPETASYELTAASIAAQIPPIREDLRQANARLCVLLGIPPENLVKCLGTVPVPAHLQYTFNLLCKDFHLPPDYFLKRLGARGTAAIPTAPAEVAIGIPCQLLTRRPDVRLAERLAAQQSAEIGVAIAEAYPMVSITGNFGWQSNRLGTLFTPAAFQGNIGPSFQWNILNYGRILNNDRAQQASFNALVATYQATVLQAQADVETGLAAFLESQEQVKLLESSVDDAFRELDGTFQQVERGRATLIPGNTPNVTATIGGLGWQVVATTLAQQADQLAQAQGNIAQGLIQTYLGLGGGWEIRCQPQDNGSLGPLVPPPAAISPQNEAGEEETVPAPPPTGKKKVPVPTPPDEWAHVN